MNRSSDILVGIDGSAESKFAIAWALAEARARNCGLILVHACEAHDYGLWTTTKGLRAGLREMARPIIDEGLALAAKIDPKIPARGGVLVGSPNRILVRLSSLVSLVVIGRNGRGAVSRLLLGSVTQYLAANSGCPVVAVGCPPRGIDTATVDRVVAAIASASINVQTLRFAFAEAAHRNSPLEVVHAAREADEPASPEQTQLAHDLVALRGEYPGVEVTSTAFGGSLTEAIASICTPGDLLVLGHRRRLPFARHSLGGRATAALHAASCPVAVVHEHLREAVMEPAQAVVAVAPAI